MAKAKISLADIQKKLDLISKILFSAFQIILLIAVGYFLWMLGNFIYAEQEGITILPFDTSGMGGDCSGKAVADRIGMEMQKIRGIHDYKRTILASMNNATPEDIAGTPLKSTSLIPPIFSEAKTLDKRLLQMGNVDVGPASISLGQMLLMTRSITNSSDRSITGSLESYGSNISIMALMEDKGSDKGTMAWERTLPIEDHNASIEENVPALIKDLAYNIFNDIRRDSGTDDSHRSWISFKYLTEGWMAYRNYDLTGNLRHLEKAENMMRTAFQEDPRDNESTQLLAALQSAYQKIGDRERSDALLDIAIQMPVISADAWFSKGVAFSSREMWSNAIEAFDNAINIDPSNKLYWVSKSYALNKLSGKNDHKKKALAAAEKAIQIDPQYADAWHEKGISLYYLGKYNNSLEAHEKSINLDGSKWWYYHDFALTLWLKGRTDGCNECYEKAIESLDTALEMNLDSSTEDYIRNLRNTIKEEFESSRLDSS